MTLQLDMHFQHQLCQASVVPAGTQRVRQHGAGIVQSVVKCLQHPLQHPLPQQPGIPLVQHPKIRRQGMAVPLPGQQVGVLPQQRRAKGVHGFDVRLIHPQQLVFQVTAVRGLRQPLCQLLGDLALQLRRRRLGVGDDEKVVHMTALLHHIAKQPLHQHLCLAGPGGGRHQQRPAPVLHHSLLLWCQIQLCHCVPLPSPSVSASTACQNSSAPMGRM